MNQKPPYKPINQKRYCCVPACISMILHRRNINHGSQEEIGYDLGLVVPKVRTEKKPAAGYGTRIGTKKYSINSYFRKNNIDLKEKYFPAEITTDVKKFIIENLKNGNDIIVCFNNKKLYGAGDYGHISLIQSINNENIILIDPEKNMPKKRKVKLSKLVDAMKYHGKKNRGGFWIIY
ncbi:C39 family peptidase [archaeon]|nr:C39 family peptidase [archaeon]